VALSTAQLRKAWGPPKKARGATFIPAYQALDDVFRRWEFDAGEGDTGAYNPRPITGGTDWSLHAYGPGDQFSFWWGLKVTTALAVDVDWNNNPYGPRLITNMPRKMVDEIEAIRTVNGKQVWSWGGDYTGSKDAMHFEIVCTPADLATGIAGGTTPAPAPPAQAKPDTPAPSEEDYDDMHTIHILNLNSGREVWLEYSGALAGFARNLNTGNGEADALQRAGYRSVAHSHADAEHWKTSIKEITFAQLKARKVPV
jgi:hypothetical protein